MLVFADAEETMDGRSAAAAVARALAALDGGATGIARHAALVGAFIAAGGLAQGVADAEFAVRGADAPTPAQDAAMALLMACARAVRASWRSGFARAPDRRDIEPRLRRLTALPLPEAIRVRRAEGFAFYALYPEAHAAAAARLGRRPGMQVIGVRSIGAALSAAVAEAVGAAPPVTVRPVGDPFDRRLALAPALSARLAAAADAAFAVVDEGPGLSGSSFCAVADALERLGAAPRCIHFFPGHDGGPGPRALPRHRARWAAARRHVVGFDELVLRAPRPTHRLESWVADLVGPAEGPPEDISGGLWRRRRGAEEAGWPPAALHQERRKFLLRAGGSTWLLKFAGLGPEGERKAALARALSAAGFTPPCAGWRHGFLVERWIEDARPLEPDAAGRPAVIERIGRYLAFRARRFPADAASGAAPALLLDMARHNATEALGTAAGALFGRWSPAGLEGEIRRVVTDNRMHAWEWLCLPDGRVLKADAVDHHAAHDLVGCQDVAWDVAGAVVELELGPAELARLLAVLGACRGRPLSRPLLEAMLPCYAAFQLGCHALAAEALAAVPEERARLERAAQRYACRLEALLRPSGAAARGVLHGTR